MYNILNIHILNIQGRIVCMSKLSIMLYNAVLNEQNLIDFYEYPMAWYAFLFREKNNELVIVNTSKMSIISDNAVEKEIVGYLNFMVSAEVHDTDPYNITSIIITTV